MLTRMYNLGIHASGLPLDPCRTPWLYIVYWSRLLEQAIEKRGLQDRLQAAIQSRRRGKR